MAIRFKDDSANNFSSYECKRCGTAFETDEAIRNCPRCRSPFLERVSSPGSQRMTERFEEQYEGSWDDDTGVNIPEPPMDGVGNIPGLM